MANNVIVQVVGGEKKVHDDVETVADLSAKLELSGYTATVNGEPADDDEPLEDNDFVTFAKAAKGA